MKYAMTRTTYEARKYVFPKAPTIPITAINPTVTVVTRSSRVMAPPLPRIATDALSEQLRSYPAGPDDFVFRSPEGAATRLSNWRNRVWEPAVKAAGLGHLRPHDLRQTAVALWIAAGASPREIAARAGHSSVVTVLDRYGHLLPGSEDKVNDALDAVASGSADKATVTAIG
jgi:integrase